MYLLFNCHRYIIESPSITMVLYGHVYVCMSKYGYVWVLYRYGTGMVSVWYGYVWVFMSTCVCMGIFGYH